MTTPTDPPKPRLVQAGGNNAGEPTPPHNVVDLPVMTTLNMPPDKILQGAMGELDCVVVVGYTKGDDGVEYFASSTADVYETAWMLQRALYKLMVMRDGEESD